MGLALRAYDEMPGRPRVAVPGLTVASTRVTVEELIRQRVVLEVARRGLPPPASSAARDGHPDEWRLDPARRRRVQARGAVPDLETASALALEAFRRGRIILLINDRQIESLDAGIGVSETTEVTFPRLVPLVGG
jgi:hypothetical protein